MGKPINESGLTDKQERFCKEYLIDSNGLQAAIRAGYSAHTAREIASEMLSKPHIQKKLNELRAKLAKKLEVSAERVVNELARIGFADPRKTMRWGPDGVELIDSASLEDDDARAVAEVSQTTTKDGGSIRIKHHDKVAALEKLGKHLGLFAEIQIHKDGGPEWDLSLLSDEDLAHYQRIRQIATRSFSDTASKEVEHG